jgi:serine/threonine-protein kinase
MPLAPNIRFGHHEIIALRFEQEAKSTSSLNHPNILAGYDFGNYYGNRYLAMELLNGEELRAQIATGLAAAHEKGIVHVKILDFGLAKLTGRRNAEFGMRNEEAA